MCVNHNFSHFALCFVSLGLSKRRVAHCVGQDHWTRLEHFEYVQMQTGAFELSLNFCQKNSIRFQLGFCVCHVCKWRCLTKHVIRTAITKHKPKARHTYVHALQQPNSGHVDKAKPTLSYQLFEISAPNRVSRMMCEKLPLH